MKGNKTLSQQKSDMEQARLNYRPLPQAELQKLTNIRYVFTEKCVSANNYAWHAQCTCGWHEKEIRPIDAEESADEENKRVTEELRDRFSSYKRCCPSCGLKPAEQVFDDVVMNFGTQKAVEYNDLIRFCLVTAERTNLPDDSILIRYFKFTETANFVYNTVSGIYKEIARAFVSEQNHYFYVLNRRTASSFRKANITCFLNDINFDSRICTTPEKIKKLIKSLPKDSFRSKMLSLWYFGTGECGNTMHIPGEPNVITAIQQYPQIYALFELGYKKIAEDFCISPSLLKGTSKNKLSAEEILGVRAGILEEILKQTPKEMLELDTVTKWNQQTSTIDEHPDWKGDIGWCIENKILDACASALQNYKIPIPVMADSVKKLSRNSVIPTFQAANLIMRYLQKCKKTGLPTEIPEIKYFHLANALIQNISEKVMGNPFIEDCECDDGCEKLWFCDQQQAQKAVTLLLNNIHKQWIQDAIFFFSCDLDAAHSVKKLYMACRCKCTPEERSNFRLSCCITAKENEVVSWNFYNGKQKVMSFKETTSNKEPG